MARCGLLLLAVLTLSACGDRVLDYPHRQPSLTLTDANAQAAGAQLFAQLCASCHGGMAEGRSPRADFFQPPAPDFRQPRYRSLDPAYLYWRIETGKNAEPFRSRGSVMPAWGPNLTEEQLWQLVAYLRSRAGG